MSEERSRPARRAWDAFRTALEAAVAEDPRLQFTSRHPEVVEITKGLNRLLVSLKRNTIETTVHPNVIRVSLNPDDTQPCQIGDRSLNPTDAAREVLEAFTTK